jgi:hypothetical protein
VRDGDVPPVTHRQRIALVSIVVLGFLLRAAWVAHAARTPHGLIDPVFYSHHADDLAAGRGYHFLLGSEATAYYPVGYPAVLAAVWWVVQRLPGSNGLSTAVGWLNLAAGTATILLVFDAGRRLAHNTRVALAAAAVVAFWPNLIVHTSVALSETLFNALMVGFVIVLLRVDWARARPSWVHLGAAGLVLGASVLVRPQALLVVPVLVFVWWRPAHHGWRPALRNSALVVVGALVLIAPWMIRNVGAVGSPTISTNLGDNLCIGHNPVASGGFELPDYCFGDFQGLRGLAHGHDETTRNNTLTRRALSWAVRHPVDEVRLTLWRAYFTVHNDHDGVQAAESYGADPFLSNRWRPVLENASDAWFYATLALALLAVPFVCKHRPGWSLWLWTLVALVVPPLLFFGDPRFKVPAAPFLAVLAGVTIVRATTSDGRAARDHRRVAAGAT